MFKKLVYGLIAPVFLVTASAALAQEAANPLAAYEDEETVILSGTISEIRNDEFDLNYGAGIVTVELDGWGWTGSEARYLPVGERVTVTGRIDDDLFEGREIKADNLHLPQAFVYYYAADTMPSYNFFNGDDLEDGSFVSMRGTVTDISNDELTIVSSNNAAMKVDTDDLGYNPFDDQGVQRIRIGETVYVYGEIDDDFFESREIDAEAIILLSQAGT